jgi:hypothetical protein
VLLRPSVADAESKDLASERTETASSGELGDWSGLDLERLRVGREDLRILLKLRMEADVVGDERGLYEGWDVCMKREKGRNEERGGRWKEWCQLLMPSDQGAQVPGTGTGVQEPPVICSLLPNVPGLPSEKGEVYSQPISHR